MAIETTGNGEFNARDARRIASRSENPYISRFEKEIKQAAEDGDRGVLLCYTDCCSNAHAALAVLEGRGFTIVRRRECHAASRLLRRVVDKIGIGTA